MPNRGSMPNISQFGVMQALAGSCGAGYEFNKIVDIRDRAVANPTGKEAQAINRFVEASPILAEFIGIEPVFVPGGTTAIQPSADQIWVQHANKVRIP